MEEIRKKKNKYKIEIQFKYDWERYGDLECKN